MNKSMFAQPGVPVVNWRTLRTRVERPESDFSAVSVRTKAHTVDDVYLQQHTHAAPLSRSGYRSAQARRVSIRGPTELPSWLLLPLAKRPAGWGDVDSSAGGGGRVNRASKKHSPEIHDVLNGLDASDGLEEGMAAADALVALVEGDTELAAANRAAVHKHPGVFGRIGVLLEEEIDTAKLLHLLGQLAFMHDGNSILILSTQGMAPKIVDIAHGHDEACRLEAARLLNNLAAASTEAALFLGKEQAVLDALGVLCTRGSFSTRRTATGAVNVLSRQPKLAQELLRSNLVQRALAASLRDQDKVGSEEYQVFYLAITCALGNLMGSFERKSWVADRRAMDTLATMLRCAERGESFGGVTPTTGSVLYSLKGFTASPANKLALIETGVLDALVEHMETWTEDPRRDLGQQLFTLETAISIVSALMPVIGCKQRLCELDIGGALTKIVKSKPSNYSVTRCQRLLREMGMRDVFLEDEGRRSGGGGQGAGGLGASKSVPYTEHRPLSDGSIKRPPPRREPSMSVRSSDDMPPCCQGARPRAGGPMGETAAWHLPAQQATVQFVRFKAAARWHALLGELEGGAGVRGTSDVYKLLGRHGVWLDGGEEVRALAELFPAEQAEGGEGRAEAPVDCVALAGALRGALEQDAGVLTGQDSGPFPWDQGYGEEEAAAAHEHDPKFDGLIEGQGALLGAVVGGRSPQGSFHIPQWKAESSEEISVFEVKQVLPVHSDTHPIWSRLPVRCRFVVKILGRQLKEDAEKLYRGSREIDPTGSGRLLASSFREVMQDMGWKVTDSELGRLTQTYDRLGDGLIDYKEFYKAHELSVNGPPHEVVPAVERTYQACVINIKNAPGMQPLTLFHSASNLEAMGKKGKMMRRLRKPKDVPRHLRPKVAPVFRSAATEVASMQAFASVQSYIPDSFLQIMYLTKPDPFLMGLPPGHLTQFPPPSTYQESNIGAEEFLTSPQPATRRVLTGTGTFSEVPRTL